MIEIDGSQGEGGGQIIRSSLALSAVTGVPIQLNNIRAGRKKPGLMTQHLTAVNAVAKICDATVSGDQLRSKSLTFEPQAIRAGEYDIRMGTAGSTTLIAQTILPALMLSDAPSTVTVTGGTHNPWAPPFDFLQRTYLPQLAKQGPQVTAALTSYGFYPVGGGKFQLDVSPQPQLDGLELMQRGSEPKPRVTAIVAGVPKTVGQRECDTIRRKSQWSAKCFDVYEVDDPIGAGNVVLIELVSANVTEVFIGIGKVGVKAEDVARDVYRQAKRYLATDVPVGEYLADQLMMPMGIAASQGRTSRFRTGRLSMHSRTHIDVLKMFLEISVTVDQLSAKEVVVTFAPATSQTTR